MARSDSRAALLDTLASALVLADPSDPETLADLVVAAGDVRRWAREHTVDAGAAETLARTVQRIAARGTQDASADMEELERLFVAVQRDLEAADGEHAESPERPAVAAGASTGADAEPPSPPAVRDVTPLAGDAELLGDFVVRATEHAETAEQQLLALEKEPSDTEALNGVFRMFHTIKGMAGFLALSDIEALAHRTEAMLEDSRKKGSLDAASVSDCLDAVDAMRSLIAESVGYGRDPLGAKPDAPPKPVTPVSAPTAPVSAADRRSLDPPAASVSESEVASTAGSRPVPAPAAVANNVRVDGERLDRLLDTIGELVIAESMFSEAARAEVGGSSALTAQLGRLDKITRELQEMATSLRMTPLQPTFARAARLVRDLSHKGDKLIDFVMSGGETELDKLVVDRIYDPLVHILRNAVDHGVEPPAERRTAGKPETARIELTAFHRGGRIHIEVADDGRGLDAQAILSAARRRGLVAEDDRPDGKELVDLVFAPGLSTASAVTDVSGRGVGMDVVRRTVESLRGEIEMTSEPGAGTQISIRLPLTLAIIDGMVVRVGDERYIIPTLSIERSLRPQPGQICTVLGRGSVLTLDDALVPLVALGELFGVGGRTTRADDGIVVVVAENGERVGLVACEILGQQQIVIKPLGDSVHQAQGVAGGAIMPDGQVGLIVDPGGLVRLARTQEVLAS